MRLYDKLEEFLRSFPTGPPDGISFEIFDALVKTWSVLRGATPYPRIMVALSGGSDGDITLDMLERIGHPYSEIHYVFYDTKMEFAATRRHLDFLEEKYGIRIERRDAKVSVPLGVKRCGVPFLNKRASDYLFRLRRHGFQWEDEPLERLVQVYPDCRSALRWWCNDWGEKSRINIRRHRWLKEFLMEHPPDFSISDKCCSGAKKASALEAEREIAPDLTILGLRKAEGGARATVYRSCFDSVSDGPDRYRPVFWFRKKDKEIYERVFGVTHSECYRLYGLKRTGCACCPFGRDFEAELAAAKQYEPNLYTAAKHVFGPSYDYTRKYHAYVRSRECAS